MRTLTLLLFFPAAALAGKGTPCDACEACTAELAKSGGHARLSADLTAQGGTCVEIAGAGARLDGAGFAIRGAATGVKIAADRAFVTNLKIEGGEVGVAVSGARVTLLQVKTEGVKIGVRGEGSRDLRVVRSETKGGDVGLALGALPSGEQCPATTLTEPGAVVQRGHFAGARIGVAACGARPVLTANRVENNAVGVLLGAPGKGAGPGADAPFDACVCAPELEGVQPGTTLFFSSGCGGCQVHEGWLPEVRATGADIRLRESGRENKAKMDAYDAYTRRCAPEIIDAIGTPGCVPNYACPASGEVFKRKGPDGRLVRDAQLTDAAAVSGFAAECATSAKASYGPKGGACVQVALRDNFMCGNRAADLRAAKGATTTTSGNTCRSAEGLEKCAAPCPADTAVSAPPSAPPAPVAAAEPTPAAPEASAPKAGAAAAPEPAAPPAAAASTPEPAGPPGWLVGFGLLGLLALAGLGYARMRKR